MKIWIKYLIFIGVGLLLSVLFPPMTPQNQASLNFIYELVIRFGRYTLVPVLFFSVAISFYKLRDSKLLTKSSLWVFAMIIASSIILLLVGLSVSLAVVLPRIPITTEKITEVQPFEWHELLTKIFPYSAMETLTNGVYLLPVFIFAGLIGAGAASDKASSRQMMAFFDSMNRVLYNVLSFFTEVFAVGMIAVMIRWTFDFSSVLKSGVYNGLLLMLTVIFLMVALVIYPLVLRILCHDIHPYRVLYASICPFLVAFFSGDTNLTLAVNLRHGKESLGIKRRINSFSYTLFSVFGRGGSALVQAICFVVILRSYSSLGISVSDAFWIALMSFVLSFSLAGIPAGGPFIALTVMCSMYGRGFESGYLLLKTAAPIICAFAAGIDALTAMFGSYIVAVKTKTIQHQEIKKFI